MRQPSRIQQPTLIRLAETRLIQSRRVAKVALVLLLAVWPHAAMPTPIYLRTDSRFPSGHHPRQWLEARTRNVQFQRWIRVQTKDGAYGWLPEDHLLTALKLSAQAVITEDTPARNEREMDAILGRPTLKKGTKALVLEISGSWAKVRPLPAADTQDTWLPTNVLTAVIDPTAPNKAFVHTATPLRLGPLPHARSIGSIKEESFVSVVKEVGEWIEVQSRVGSGFIRRTDAWTVSDLGDTGARALFDLAPLRSAPIPYADLIRNLPVTAPLTILTQQTLRWGQVSIKEMGDVWWPISDDDASDLAGPQALALKVKLGTAELFSRKIFDMASSRAIPSLKFVSAQGIFRTVDGKEWTKIPIFQDQNYPIAIALGGAVFVGPYVSDDNGETFQQWIRWDTLVASLDVHQEISAKNIQILEIKPQDTTGRRVTVRLSLGLKSAVRVVTEDQGLSWRTY